MKKLFKGNCGENCEQKQTENNKNNRIDNILKACLIVFFTWLISCGLPFDSKAG
jgi:hypothetical protein|tara:strand:+ start:4814 stop:4975 length:162 start_codon:yes stop_codon:yes gene_type:complete